LLKKFQMIGDEKRIVRRTLKYASTMSFEVDNADGTFSAIFTRRAKIDD